MRTTVTLDADTEARLRRVMAERGVSFKQALNDAVRAGTAGPTRAAAAVTKTRDMGVPRADLDRALQLAAAEEDAESMRRLRLGR